MKGVDAQVQSKHDHWLFLLGGRQDWVDSDFRDKVANATNISHLTVDLNAKNLFGKEYVSGCNDAGRCYWGEDRTLLGYVSYYW